MHLASILQSLQACYKPVENDSDDDLPLLPPEGTQGRGVAVAAGAATAADVGAAAGEAAPHPDTRKQGQPNQRHSFSSTVEIYDGAGRCGAVTCADDGRNVEPLPPPNPSCQRDIETVVSKRKKKSSRVSSTSGTETPYSHAALAHFFIWCLVPVYRYSTRVW